MVVGTIGQRSLRHNGLVIDLSAMRTVEIDPEARIATVAGGATASDVVAAASRHGLVAVTGSCGMVGMTGLTLGGGYGQLSPRHGLALDNLLGADVVLGDGRSITTDAVEHPDLFWALRGGGGNFGVVTSLRIRLHPITEVLAGLILFPWEQAQSVLDRYTALVASVPDELGVLAGILSATDGSPVVFLAPLWSGDFTIGTPLIAEIQQFGTPIRAQVGPMTYGETLGMFNAQIVNGRNAGLTPAVIAELIVAGGARTSPLSMIVLHHCRGAATRVAPMATSFGLRREHFMLEIIAAWEPCFHDNGGTHRQWTHKLWQAMASAALPGGYANILGPGDRGQIRLAHGPNIGRLRTVKQHYDPDKVFSAIPLAT